MLTAFLALLILGPDAEIKDPLIARAADRGIWYDAETLTPVYQVGGYVRRVGNDSTDPNSHAPWRVTGGADNVANLRARKFLYVPEGQKIAWWTVTKPTAAGRSEAATVVWAFPPGTVLGETLADADGVFEIRVRIRQETDWQRIVLHSREVDGKTRWEADNTPSRTPQGLVRPSSCVQCHDDVGVDQSLLKGTLAGWAGKVRGSDGIFSWHPFEVPREGHEMRPVFAKRFAKLMRRRLPGEEIPIVTWLQY